MSLTLTLERGGGEISGSGTNIELDGTIAGGAIESVEMYGDTEQTTYSGKNKYNATKASSTSNTVTTSADTGQLYVNGTTTTDFGIEFGYTSLPAGTYTFCLELVSGSITSTSTGGLFNFRGDNITLVSCPISNSTKKNSVQVTVSANTTNARIQLWCRTSETFTNAVIKYQLVSGSTADYDFEPYVGGTASPNPDYPQEVQTVTGRQVVTISDGDSQSQEYEINLGKNLLDESTMESGSFNYLNGGLFANATFIRSQQIPCEPNTTYAFSSNSNLGEFAVVYYASDKTTVVPGEGYLANYRSTTFTTPATARYMRVKVGGSANPRTLDGDWDLQIEKGSTATTYAPYFTPIELCKIGTYQDYIYKSGNDWYVHKEINQLVLNGSESWETTGTNVYALYVSGGIKSVAEGLLGVCNYYTFNPVQTNVTITLTTGQFAVQYINPNTQHRVFMKNTAISTTSDFQTWLGTHNTKVCYPLATPTDTQITNSALIAQLEALNEATTYDGKTVITVASENLAGSLEVTVSTNIAKTYTEVEIGSPFTITDVEGKSSNTTLDGNVYVDWAYNKKQYSFDLFNLTPQDYADIRAFYDYQFNNSAFPTITVPELNIDKLPVYMEISSRNIINQCLLTDKLTIKFRETVQP